MLTSHNDTVITSRPKFQCHLMFVFMDSQMILIGKTLQQKFQETVVIGSVNTTNAIPQKATFTTC